MSTPDLNNLAIALADLESAGNFDDGSTRITVCGPHDEHELRGPRDAGFRDSDVNITRDGDVVVVTARLSMAPPKKGA